MSLGKAKDEFSETASIHLGGIRPDVPKKMLTLRFFSEISCNSVDRVILVAEETIHETTRNLTK